MKLFFKLKNSPCIGFSLTVWFAFGSEALAIATGIFSQINRNELPGGALNKTVAKCDLIKKSENVYKKPNIQIGSSNKTILIKLNLRQYRLVVCIPHGQIPLVHIHHFPRSTCRYLH